MTQTTDIVIIGAGPVGLMCAYLGRLCGLRIVIIDKSSGPVEVGRADALNARTLQLFEIAKLFGELYPIGKKCNTLSVWSDGKFLSRQSSWWEELEGCFHKHFLMIGQTFTEKILVKKLEQLGVVVKREIMLEDVQLTESGCLTKFSNNEIIHSRYVIGADGSRSSIRELFKIPFEITRPEIIWAVIDGVIETDFPKVPDIIVFQSETSEVAWIPREGDIDRFYIRMDKKNFSIEDAVEKINHAIKPHALRFKEIAWFSQFSVKESVAEAFQSQNRVFLAGDACHIHSVNGGQGLNTGMGDAFNLMWKLNMVINFGFKDTLLESYENERKPVAMSVVETSGKLVRSTKYSDKGTHAQDYVKIVEARSGNVTGMGIRYGDKGLEGSRLFDCRIFDGSGETRLYSLLDYTRFLLLVFSDQKVDLKLPDFIKIIQIYPNKCEEGYWTEAQYYTHQVMLVRPDAYIHSSASLENGESLSKIGERFLTQFMVDTPSLSNFDIARK